MIVAAPQAGVAWARSGSSLSRSLTVLAARCSHEFAKTIDELARRIESVLTGEAVEQRAAAA